MTSLGLLREHQLLSVIVQELSEHGGGHVTRLGSPDPSRVSPPLLAFVSVRKAADGAFGWGGTPVIWQHWCPEVRLSVNRNHAQEEKAKSLIDDEILGENPTRESEAYRSFAYLAIGFQTVRIQR